MSQVALGLALRVGFYAFGLYQDAHWPLPYTDVDYYVFTDAARYVADGFSPFLRATYRYTPLLAWALVPTVRWFSFGKFLFIICDLLTGYLIQVRLDPRYKRLALIWLLNPMVITISTRGSSESLLTSAILLAVHFIVSAEQSQSLFKLVLGGLVFGLSVHLKIYPFIYAPTFLLFMGPLFPLITVKRVVFTLSSFVSFVGLTYWMYTVYGYEYIYESFIYHLVRLDHRHNFSMYNVLLYYTSYEQSATLSIERLAFIPQLGLCLVVIPFTFRKALSIKAIGPRVSFLTNVLFIQTFIFVTFNKVCTSQYFIWFLCFLPQYISTSTLSWRTGLVLGALWVLTQAAWLYNGWRLEFLGKTGVFDWLFVSSAAFFAVNTLIVVVLISDVRNFLLSELKTHAIKD